MAMKPAKASRESERDIGRRVLEISTRIPNQDDEDFLKANLERAPGDDTPVDPVEIRRDTAYPGKTILVAESEHYENGRQQFVHDVENGVYFNSEWLNQVVVHIEREGQKAVQNGTLEQETLDSTMDFLRRLPGVTSNPLSPEEFFEYLVGEYVCRQCY